MNHLPVSVKIEKVFPAFPAMDEKIESLCVELTRRSSALGKGLPPPLIASIRDFMVPVLSYYTNAMEGNPSRLADIENALAKKFSGDVRKRNYQIEHLAHAETQKAIRKRLSDDPYAEVTSPEFIRWIHAEFYRRLPDEFHGAQMTGGERIPFVAGDLRTKGAVVGRHEAPATVGDITRCLDDFHRCYDPKVLSELERLAALAASHHRLLWIHPFPDGNGRVARLFTEAYACAIRLNPDGLWTVTRAFARHRSEYDARLSAADSPRWNDYDGRGPLSERKLGEFCAYFLASCLDQVAYMESLLDLKTLHERCEIFLTGLLVTKNVAKSVSKVLRLLLEEGEVSRRAVREICRVKERRASQVIREILDGRYVVSPSAYGPLKLRITSDMATVVFPKLV